MPIDRTRWREELKALLPETSWPQPEHDDGWRDLVCDLVDALNSTGVPYTVDQIKQKFGELRFYFDAPDDHPRFAELCHLVEEAEAKSLTICEMCGQLGELRKKLCVKTLCNSCYEGKRKSDFRFMDKPTECI